MKFRCYEGRGHRVAEYHTLHPLHAAERFAAQLCESDDTPVSVVVTPADDEAKARPGWKSDADEPQCRLFKVHATVSWAAQEVRSFNA